MNENMIAKNMSILPEKISNESVQKKYKTFVRKSLMKLHQIKI